MAPVVSPLHVLRIRAVLRVDVGGRGVSQRLRLGGPLSVHEPAGGPWNGRRRGAVNWSGRTARAATPPRPGAGGGAPARAGRIVYFAVTGDQPDGSGAARAAESGGDGG